METFKQLSGQIEQAARQMISEGITSKKLELGFSLVLKGSDEENRRNLASSTRISVHEFDDKIFILFSN